MEHFYSNRKSDETLGTSVRLTFKFRNYFNLKLRACAKRQIYTRDHPVGMWHYFDVLFVSKAPHHVVTYLQRLNNVINRHVTMKAKFKCQNDVTKKTSINIRQIDVIITSHCNLHRIWKCLETSQLRLILWTPYRHCRPCRHKWMDMSNCFPSFNLPFVRKYSTVSDVFFSCKFYVAVESNILITCKYFNGERKTK